MVHGPHAVLMAARACQTMHLKSTGVPVTDASPGSWCPPGSWIPPVSMSVAWACQGAASTEKQLQSAVRRLHGLCCISTIKSICPPLPRIDGAAAGPDNRGS